MSKESRFYIRITEDEKFQLKSHAKEKGFSSVSAYVKSQLLNHEKQISIISNFRTGRLNSRGIRLEEEIWQKIKQVSPKTSDFIRQAILEKLLK